MREIKLTNSDLVALVDDEDYEYLNQFKWKLTNRGYVITHILMHQLVLKPIDNNKVIDHINHTCHDNRRNNLRECTTSQNMQNKRKLKNSSSQYKGVSYDEDSNKWRAFITFEKIRYHIGTFNTEKEAGMAYDQMAVYFFKEYANLNFAKQESYNIIEPEFIINRKSLKKSSKYNGVCLHKQTGKYCARYGKKHIGSFDTEELAYLARVKYEKEQDAIKAKNGKELKGLIFCTKDNLWVAKTTVDKKYVEIGKYETREVAIRERDMFLIKNNLLTGQRRLFRPDLIKEYKEELGIE